MRISLIVLIILVVILGFTVWQRFFRDDFNLPVGGETRKEVLIIKDGTVIGVKDEVDSLPDENIDNSINEEDFETISEKEIMITDGVKHSIPLAEILSGGPPKDGIPSIDNPKFISIEEADKLLDGNEVGLGFAWKGEARFYPNQILVWHEIVNDNVGGDPILITYCPLCATSIVFDPHINGTAVEFGTSGKLWQSNLLMYNRSADPAQESLWSQVLGEAVLGELTGTILKVLPADTMTYDMWKKAHPDTKVLSRDTGTSRRYGSDPYGDYYTNTTVGFGANFKDDRLHPKEFVLGIKVNDKFKAYQSSALPLGETITDSFADETIIIEKNEFGEVRMYKASLGGRPEDGDKKPLSYIGGFWFSWAAVHPETELYSK